jgi:hypothetical protein
MNYQQKYLKYKTKYLNLKSLSGGGDKPKFKVGDYVKFNDSLPTHFSYETHKDKIYRIREIANTDASGNFINDEGRTNYSLIDCATGERTLAMYNNSRMPVNDYYLTLTSAPSCGAGSSSVPSVGAGSSSAPSGEAGSSSVPSVGAGSSSAPSGGAGSSSAPSAWFRY